MSTAHEPFRDATPHSGAHTPPPTQAEFRAEHESLGEMFQSLSAKLSTLVSQEIALAKAEAATEAKVWVMAPMISTAEEAEAFTQKARSYGLKTAGMMIEVPSAALMADKLFEHADFGVVGDIFQVVPQVIEQLRTRRG